MFEALLSNNRMKAELSRAITENRPMHAYLFCGAEGSGKLTAAKLCAAYLVGKNADKVERDSHPDIFILRPEADKKLITVEQVRKMRQDAFVHPTEAPRKIYIVDGVQLMNEAGQNALLTILEQPPAHAIFILLSERREAVLPTVISRCAVFEMEYVEASEGAAILKRLVPDAEQDRLLTAMRAAEGNIGLAAKLASSETFAKSVTASQMLLKAVAEKNEYKVQLILSRPSKEELLDFLPVLAMYIRDVIVYRMTGSEDRLVFKESVLQNINDFDKININILYDGVAGCEKAVMLINSYVSVPLIVSALGIQLCGGKQID